MASFKGFSVTALRVVATLAVVGLAGVVAWFAWQHYVYAPWTRDARVQADVVNIAPEVSGTVTRVAVSDDSYVHRGQLLFQVQPARFKHALAEAKAALDQARAQARYDRRQARRLAVLPRQAVSTQDRQQARAKANTSKATVGRRRAQLAQARQDLQWATVRSPVNGYVTHLLLDRGDYASQGQSALTLVDADTFRVTAYFEETKLDGIEIGDRADIVLMMGDTRLAGHVASIGHGIAVGNNKPGERNLPRVDPVFQWVRLAQRLPVTIVFDARPTRVPLSVGMTATVHIHPRRRADRHEPPGLRLARPPARVSGQ